MDWLSVPAWMAGRAVLAVLAVRLGWRLSGRGWWRSAHLQASFTWDSAWLWLSLDWGWQAGHVAPVGTHGGSHQQVTITVPSSSHTISLLLGQCSVIQIIAGW